MREFGEVSRAYMQAYTDWAEIEERKRQFPDLADTYEDASARAGLIMDIIGNKDEVVGEFNEAVMPPIDPHEARRRQILGLKEDELYKQGLITDTDIETQLSQLPPAPDDYSDTDRTFATAYLVVRALTSSRIFGSSDTTPVSSNGHKPAVVATPEAGGAPFDPVNSETTDGGEKEPTHLHIKVYTKDNVLKINDTEIIPLARKMSISSHNAEEERYFEELRLAAIKFIADNPDKSLLPSQIWEAIMPAEIPFVNRQEGERNRSSDWHRYIGDFLKEEFTYQGEPIVTVSKPTPTARRVSYQLGNYAPTFEFVDEESGEHLDTVFKLPNNETIGGRNGHVASLLLAASEESPVVLKTLVEEGVITLKELRALKEKKSAFLSSCVSSVRSSIKNADAEDMFDIKRRDVPLRRPKKTSQNVTIKTESGYWMADKSEQPDIEVELVLTDLPGSSETPKDPEVLQQILKTRVLADFVVDHAELLNHFGFKPLRESNTQQVKEARDMPVELAISTNEEIDERIEAFRIAKVLMEDMEAALNNCPDDVRAFTVMDFYFDNFYIGNSISPELIERFEVVVQARVSSVVRGPIKGDDQQERITRIQYTMPDNTNIGVELKDEQIEDKHDDLNDEIDPGDAGDNDDLDTLGNLDDEVANTDGKVRDTAGNPENNGKPLTRRERQQQALDELRPIATREIKSAIKNLASNDLDLTDQSISLVRLHDTYRSIHRPVFERLLGKDACDPRRGGINLNEAVLLYLATQSEDKTLRSSIGNKRLNRFVKEQIDVEVEKYKQAKARREKAAS